MNKILAYFLAFAAPGIGYAQTPSELAGRAKQMIDYPEQLQAVTDIIAATGEIGLSSVQNSCVAALGSLSPGLQPFKHTSAASSALVTACVDQYCALRIERGSLAKYATSMHCE